MEIPTRANGVIFMSSEPLGKAFFDGTDGSGQPPAPPSALALVPGWLLEDYKNACAGLLCLGSSYQGCSVSKSTTLMLICVVRVPPGSQSHKGLPLVGSACAATRRSSPP